MGNSVVHIELIGPDPDRLRTFYAELFGWGARPGGPGAPAVSDTSSYSFIEPSDGAGPAFGAHSLPAT